jgi:protein tyrosine phosphatase type 4A
MFKQHKVEFKGISFFIMETPTRVTAKIVARQLAKLEVRCLVRVCESLYDASLFESNGIKVIDCSFPAGSDPPTNVVESWNRVVKRTEPPVKIAVHCLSGLGRGPLLVGIALINMGIDAQTAIDMIRKDKADALNSTQMTYLRHYKPKRSSH